MERLEYLLNDIKAMLNANQEYMKVMMNVDQEKMEAAISAIQST
jgi:ATP phosphoribosyltransferase